MTEQAEQLVRLAQEDAPGALDRLCAVWLPPVLGWALRLGGPKVDAEDVAHDVFLVVFDRLGDLRSPGAFQSWLFGITRRVVAAHRRRAWVRRWLPGAVPDTADPGIGPARETEQSQVATRVWAALEQLSPHHREILVLCDLEERADSEVAVMLDIPKGTVKSRLRRARMQLRDRLGPLAAETLPDLEAAIGGNG
jgi:RNA polymerase sigma-70 factor (ECF subfamily)